LRQLLAELYTKLGLVTGNLPRIKFLLQEKMSTETQDLSGVMQALALTHIYLREFEEAFVLYNQLIDEQKRQDSRTLLFASIAAIGAGHKENAIILLQLAKKKDPKNYEARYGLGLLFHEVGNLKGAAIQYKLMTDPRYDSAYFDFALKAPEAAL